MAKRRTARSDTVRPLVAVHCGHMATDPTSRGERYRAAREALDLSRDEVANRARVSVKTVQRLEVGQSIRERSRIAIEGILGIGPEPEDPGPRARSIAEFTDGEPVTDLWRRLNEGTRAIEQLDRGARPHPRPDTHTSYIDDPTDDTDPDSSGGLHSSG